MITCPFWTLRVLYGILAIFNWYEMLKVGDTYKDDWLLPREGVKKVIQIDIWNAKTHWWGLQ